MTKQVRYFVGTSDEDLLISECNGLYQVSTIAYERWQDGEDEDTLCLPYHCYLSGDPCKWQDVNSWLKSGRWTKKIPLFVKNTHRAVWGLPPLAEEKIIPEWFLDYRDGTVHCPTEDYVDPFPSGVKSWLLDRQLGNAGAKRCYWLGNKEMFKTWTFSCPTTVLLEGLVPLLEGSPYVAVLKSW